MSDLRPFLFAIVLAPLSLGPHGASAAQPASRETAAPSPSPAASTAPSAAPSPAPAGSPSPAASASAKPSATPTPSFHWRSIGPAVSGGRVATVAGTDLDRALFYAGAAGGGVWKSTNGGGDWRPVFDREGTQSIGAIAISPHDVNDVWIGTGEPWPRNDVLPGDGVYHSRDGGTSWTRAGLAGTSQIARVVLDPRNAKRILVAALGDPFRDSAERGVFRSDDGGATWRKTLYLGPGVGASDLAMDPKNPDILYAGMWRFRRSAWKLTSGGAGDGIYKSSDGGATWTPVTGNGLPAGITGRIALAVAPSDAKRIYAIVESKQGLLWRSDDAGATWKLTSTNTLIDERPFYYSRLIVDPHDENHLFSVSVLLAESNTGGKTWHVSGKGLHGDHHDAWISADGRTILEGNDGGVAISRDGATSWEWRNVLPISQVYHLGYDRTDPYRVCVGLQDNGAWCAPTRTGDDLGILAQDWTKISGGDGTWIVPDPHDPTTIYAASGGGDNGGELIRFNGRTHDQLDVSVYLRDQNVVPPSQLRYRFNWETPVAFSPFAAHTVYVGGNVLFRSTDAGMHWTALSGDLTRNLRERQQLSGGPLTLDVTGAETFDTILSIAPSPRAAGTIWIGTDDGLVQLTRDGGKHWRNVSIPGVDADGRIPVVEASHRAPGTAYAVVDRHFVGDRAPYAYVTHDFGRTWRSIVHGLPQSELHVVREDPANPSVLYAGNGRGVWWSDDAGGSWKPFPAALPAVEVRDLAVQPAAHDLIAATHGRGVFVLDDIDPLRRYAAAQAAGVAFFPLRAARPLSRYTPTTNAPDASADAPAATFTFWQARPATKPPAFEIVDRAGHVVRHIAGTHEEDGVDVPNVTNLAGYNRVAWGLDRDPPTPWRRVAPWDRGPSSGPPVTSGTYTVRMIRDGKTYLQRIRVGRDPRVRSARDEQRGDAFATAIAAQLSSLDDALNGLDNVRLQLAEPIAKTKDATLAARARTVLAAATRIEATISSQPVNDQDDDFIQDLLRERVLTFYGNLAPGAQPQGLLDEGGALVRRSARALATYRTFVATQVRPLDGALRAAGFEPVDLEQRPPTVKPDPNADEHARRADEH